MTAQLEWMQKQIELLTRYADREHIPMVARLLRMAHLELVNSRPSPNTKYDDPIRGINKDSLPHVLGTWDWDVKNDILYADTGLAEAFNVPTKIAADGAPQSRFAAAVFAGDIIGLNAAIEKTVKEAQPFCAVYRLVQTDGSLKWVLAVGHAIVEDGAVTRFPGTLIDISQEDDAVLRKMIF